jgi:sporulation protein YlmC with PRC-barrel domain
VPPTNAVIFERALHAGTPDAFPSREVDAAMRLSDGNLRGRTVIASDGLAIGEIAALFLDGTTLGVESLQVELRSDIADRLGVDRSLFHAGALEIPIAMVQSVGDAVVLSVAVDALRQVLPGATSLGEAAPTA